MLRGRSGAGKTTLLNLIAGVTLPSSGTIRVDDTDILDLSESRRDRFRARQVGYVFQSFNLLAAFTAVENVMLRAGFMRRMANGEAAAFRMETDIESDQMERLVEVMQADRIGGSPSVRARAASVGDQRAGRVASKRAWPSTVRFSRARRRISMP